MLADRCPTLAELVAFSRGIPPTGRWEELAAHVELCTACQTKLAGQSANRSSLEAAIGECIVQQPSALDLDVASRGFLLRLIDLVQDTITRKPSIDDGTPLHDAENRDAGHSLSRMPFVKVYERGQLAYIVRMEAKIELGRQKSNEPVPYHLLKVDRHHRLIIAPRGNRNVSRRHLLLVNVENEIHLTSLTKKGDIRLGDGQRLSPESTRCMKPPMLIVLGNHSIRIEH